MADSEDKQGESLCEPGKATEWIFMEFVVDKAENLKLSDAIRRGSILRPPVKGAFFKRVGKDKTVCSSALGAAYEGATGEVLIGNPKKVRETLTQLFPCLYSEVQEGFFGGLPSPAMWSLGDLLVVEYEYRGKTREQLADLLEEKGY